MSNISEKHFENVINEINSLIKWKVDPLSVYFCHSDNSFHFEFKHALAKREFNEKEDLLKTTNENLSYFFISTEEVETTLPDIFRSDKLKLKKIKFDENKVININGCYKSNFERFDIESKLEEFFLQLYRNESYNFDIKEYTNTVRVKINLIINYLFSDVELPELFVKDDYDFFIIDNDENLQKLKDIFSLFVIEDISFSKFNNVPVISSISFIIKKNK